MNVCDDCWFRMFQGSISRNAERSNLVRLGKMFPELFLPRYTNAHRLWKGINDDGTELPLNGRNADMLSVESV